MKKTILFFAAALTLLACSNEDDTTFSRQENSVRSSIRSYSEAMEIAQKAIFMISNETSTRSCVSEPRTIDLAKSKKCILANRTRSEETSSNDTLMYVFNFADNNGFAIISADPNVEPILAVTESGYYDPDSLSEIDGVNDFVSLAESYILQPDTTKMDMTLEPVTDIIDLSDTIITALHGDKLSVAWGQQDPEGRFCPNNIAGCANTAMAQIMSYYNYPTEIITHFTGANRLHIDLDWSDIIKHEINHSYTTKTCTASNKSHACISYLLRELGFRNNSEYNTTPYNSTSTEISYVKSTFKDLGYTTVGYDDYSMSDVKDYIDNGYKIFMVGFADEGGHAWVVDQYADVAIDIIHVGKQFLTSWNVHFLHINWGWNGESNGYFNGRVFETSKAFSPDYGTYHGSTYNFTYGLQTLKIKK